ncbi:MAG: AMP-binding protein, partial [Candidatus Binatia bacterium]
MGFDCKISALLERAARLHVRTEVVTRSTGHRSSWGDVHARARRLASSLRRLGIEPGDRVGTLAWNTHRHIELYYAIPGAGFV